MRYFGVKYDTYGPMDSCTPEGSSLKPLVDMDKKSVGQRSFY